MSRFPSYLRPQSYGVCLAVKLQPRASTNTIVGPHGQELRVRVTTAPVDNAANDALLGLLARHLDCARRQIELIRGHTSRHKVLLIRGMPVEEIANRLGSAIPPPDQSPTAL